MPIIDVRDSFVGGAGALSGRVPTEGRADYSWQRINGEQEAQEMGGFVQLSSGTFVTAWYICGRPRTPNYSVHAFVEADGPGAIVGIMARAAVGPSYYRFWMETNGIWRLYSSVSAQLASGGAFGNSFGSHMTLEVVGTRLRAFISDDLVAEVTNADLAGPGSGGILMSTSPSGGTSRVLEYDVTELGSAVMVAG